MYVQHVVPVVVVAPPGDEEAGEHFDGLVVPVLGEGLEVDVLRGGHLPHIGDGDEDEPTDGVGLRHGGDEVLRAFGLQEPGRGGVARKGFQGEAQDLVLGLPGQHGNDGNLAVEVGHFGLAEPDDFFVLAEGKVPVVIYDFFLFHILVYFGILSHIGRRRNPRTPNRAHSA